MISSNEVESSAPIFPVEWKVIVLPDVRIVILSPPTNVNAVADELAVTVELLATAIDEKAFGPVKVIVPVPVT